VALPCKAEGCSGLGSPLFFGVFVLKTAPSFYIIYNRGIWQNVRKLYVSGKRGEG
jgi:hypothetical protein